MPGFPASHGKVPFFFPFFESKIILPSITLRHKCGLEVVVSTNEIISKRPTSGARPLIDAHSQMNPSDAVVGRLL